MEINTYVIKLRISTNGYEKNITKLVCATSEEDARRDALIGECHGDINDGTAEWEGDSINDMDDDFIYTVTGVTQVDDGDVATLRKYLS